MSDDQYGMGSAFSHWQGLSDAYAAQLEALRRHVPGASAALHRISRDLAKVQQDAEHSASQSGTHA